MGGMGSGREADVYNGTVEESLQLDINRFAREGSIRQGCRSDGIITWKGLFGSTTSSIGYTTQCYGENGHIRLHYTVSSLAMGEQAVNYAVELFTTRPYFGGFRWWFICPNQECDRMVVKLYQPPGAKYFLCRTCQNLTYQSCRDSGKYDSLYKHMAEETGLSVKEVKRAYMQLRL